MERELMALFGSVVARECWAMPTTLDSSQARRVAQMAASLSRDGAPKGQRAIVQAMPIDEQLLLCRWLADRDYAASCLPQGK